MRPETWAGPAGLLAICLAAAPAALAAEGGLQVGQVAKNVDPVARYEKLELTVPMTGLKFENPYNPEEVDLGAVFTAPSGRQWKIPGFYDGKEWKVRFAANETGEWKGAVKVRNAGREAESAAFVFTCKDSAHHGWLKVSPVDPHYLVQEDGAPWFGVGNCDLVRATFKIKELSDGGINAVVYWMFYWNPLECAGTRYGNAGVGTYNQKNCATLDKVVEEAEASGVRIFWMLWTHDQFSGNFSFKWNNPGAELCNPYHRLKGGKLKTVEWLDDPECLKYQDRLYRYAIARWGYSRAVGMWDLFCEMNGAGFGNSAKEDLWLKRTNEFFKKNDPYGHPTSASYYSESHWTASYAVVDVPTYHSYQNAQVSAMVRTLTDVTARLRASGKPAYVGEYGTGNPERRLEFMHRANWASMASGAACTPMYWWGGDQYTNPPGSMPAKTYLEHQAVLARFVADLPFGAVKLDPLDGKDLSFVAGEAEPAAPAAAPFEQEVVPEKSWGKKQPAGPVLIRAKGRLEDDAGAVNVHLMGGTHQEFQSVLLFGAKFGKDGRLILHADGVSKSGARLRVSVDDKPVLDENFTADPKRMRGEWESAVDRELTIKVPEGLHLVKVEAEGDWVKVDRYRFGNLLELGEKDVAQLKSGAAEGSVYGLRGDGLVVLYLANVARFAGRQMNLAKMPAGKYAVEWWDTWDGKVLAKGEASPRDGALPLTVPAGTRDMACKIRRAGN